MRLWFHYTMTRPDHGQLVWVFRPRRKVNRAFLAAYVISSQLKSYAWMVYNGKVPNLILPILESDQWAVPLRPKLPT